MFGRGSNSELRRIVADFLIALALFWGVAFAVSGSHNHAHAVSPPEISEEAILLDTAASSRASMHAAAGQALQFVHKVQPSREQALALLSVAFAALVALNLAFLRHLRRVYASPRRSVWRRG